ncbi:MAG: hypothetical protein WAR79_19210 [Melioribacteraceae bacterium]
MSQFLRDEVIKNINIDESSLDILNQYFVSNAIKIRDSLVDNPENEKKIPILNYVIRFDNKGYRLFDFQEILKFYNQANKVERIIFTLESSESISSGRNSGSYLELKLDTYDLNNCYLVASSDDEDWVDLVFNGIQEILNKFHNKSRFVQNYWTIFVVQIFGVMLGFVLSLWAAIKISPYLSIENAFVISFLFIFLIFANSWTLLHRLIIKLLNYSFPNLRFKHKGRTSLHWLLQALVGGLIIAFAIFLLNKIFEFIGSVIGGFIK